MEKFKIPVSLLSPDIDVACWGFADTSELPPLDVPIGQDRAIEALDFGLGMQGPGFNIFASGSTGIGKWEIVHQRIQRVAASKPTPADWCYVHNFRDHSSPRCLSFPASKGRAFKQAMAALIQGLRRDIPAAFESSKYLDARAKILEEHEAKKQDLIRAIEGEARVQGFTIREEPIGFALVPLREGRPMTQEEAAKLTDEQKRELIEHSKALEGRLRELHARLHALDHEAQSRIGEMDRLVVRAVMQSRFLVLREHYKALPEVLEYLQQVEDDIVENYKDFLPRAASHVAVLGGEGEERKSNFTRYEVNVIVEHAPDGGAPIVDEPHPTYANLIGKIERKAHLGVVYADFTEIKAGACLQANGGFLILDVWDVLRQPFAWDALKRVIKTRSVKIEDPGEYFGVAITSLRPQPIPVDLKVILHGPPLIFYLLQTYDDDFSKLFKVKADFDVDSPRDHDHELLYARFIGQVCRDEHLPHFSADAVGEVIRRAVRLAERRDRVTLRMNWIKDLVREAAYWAKQDGRTVVTASDVERAIAKKQRRENLLEEWIQNEIKEGTLMVDLDGETVGQVNGLSVHQLGDYAFGRPCRITARTFVGNKGVIDIQREAELAGHIHSKGVMTLAGYLAGKFAGDQPFALSATLTFEQTYSEVEGDSAAVAELIAILSSLADVPVRQSLAVTGSVNQLGEVQPVGGVNEKIEGFFESCKQRGLTGRQGVVIPSRNIKNLALSREVVEAVAGEKFAVYGVTDVEEALELLTGLPAGERGADGKFPPETIYGRAVRRLAEMAKIAAAWSERHPSLQSEESGPA
ncbi:MAG: ATP-binding protein [Nitrospirae bacterium]|nr:MAG: ATP-binding protein [Nitrospirota bacterium]